MDGFFSAFFRGVDFLGSLAFASFMPYGSVSVSLIRTHMLMLSLSSIPYCSRVQVSQMTSSSPELRPNLRTCGHIAQT